MTTGLEELIAGISRSPKSPSVLTKITKNNLAPPPSSITNTQSQPTQEPEEEEDIEQKHDDHDENNTTKELKQSSHVRKRPRDQNDEIVKARKATRHIRQEQERLNAELSLPFLNKQFPKSRLKRVLKRGGATACIWKIENEEKLGIQDIIRIHALARVARLMTEAVRFATQKQYDRNGDPVISCDKDDPSKIDDATTHNFKIRLQDVLEAGSTCNANYYSGDLL